MNHQQVLASMGAGGGGLITVTGGTLTFDGLYSVRTFTSSGTLGVSGGNLAAEYLVVGGGGAGGSGFSNSPAFLGGGGGEGGEVLTGSTTINAGSYTVTIGGSNQDTTVGALFTALKGNNGSNADYSGGPIVRAAGGTGNPGADGGIGCSSLDAGAGVNGTISSITGTSTYYGGGGGGGGQFPYTFDNTYPGRSGIGGLGGGGAGASGSFSSGSAGTANTGGGGGGGATNGAGPGLAGGSGVFIIRYLTAGTN